MLINAFQKEPVMPLPTQTTADAAPIDPTDAAVHDCELMALLGRHLAAGVSHNELLASLLHQFTAMATVYPCCTASAGKAALQVGGQLIVAAIDRPANATTH